jgi:uncharacterized protein (DUF2461 family)
MTFRGWPAEALEFLSGLQAENSKVYWQRNRERLRQDVSCLDGELKELAPDWDEGRMLRPYRDIRFSSNKSPYKTNIPAVIGQGNVQSSDSSSHSTSGC